MRARPKKNGVSVTLPGEALRAVLLCDPATPLPDGGRAGRRVAGRCRVIAAGGKVGAPVGSSRVRLFAVPAVGV